MLNLGLCKGPYLEIGKERNLEKYSSKRHYFEKACIDKQHCLLYKNVPPTQMITDLDLNHSCVIFKLIEE